MSSFEFTTYEELEVVVVYDFTPAYDGGRVEPSYGAGAQVVDILLPMKNGATGTISIMDAFDSKAIARLEEEALEQHED